MEYLLECNVSGVGETFVGTFSDAISRAREIVRFPEVNSGTIIWHNQEKVAVIRRETGFSWIKESWQRHL